MSYENVKLWFAKNDNEQIITIDEINDQNRKNTYLCPVCGSQLKPKAVKSTQVTSHFAHVDASKCNSESQIHFWFKHRFLEKGDKFAVVADETREYVCKEVLVEQSYDVNGEMYRPDVTIFTEGGNTIYFKMAFTNKKKVKDYLDIWLELKNIVVEVDIKQLMLKDKIPTFKGLFYDGKCINTKRNDTYYNTIGKYKEEKLKGNVNEELKERIRKLDWFWDDVFKYKTGEVDIEHMVNLIDCIDSKERRIVDEVLKKQSCNFILKDYRDYKKHLKKLMFGSIIGEVDKYVKNTYGEEYILYLNCIEYDDQTDELVIFNYANTRDYKYELIKFNNEQLIDKCKKFIDKNITYNKNERKINDYNKLGSDKQKELESSEYYLKLLELLDTDKLFDLRISIFSIICKPHKFDEDNYDLKKFTVSISLNHKKKVVNRFYIEINTVESIYHTVKIIGEHIGANIENDTFSEINLGECKECDKQIKLSIKEVRFFASKDFSLPKRCKSCRDKRKQTKLNG